MKKGIKTTMIMTLTFAAALNMNGCGVYGGPETAPPSAYDDYGEVEESTEFDDEEEFDASDNLNEDISASEEE